MRTTTIAALAIMLVSVSPSILHAQTLKTKGPPAEFPPTSFKGKQFIDSRGCMYIRAGNAGAVTWVPRVNQKRTHICGQTPTNLSGLGPTTVKPSNNTVEVITIEPTPQPKSTKPVASAKTTGKGNQAKVKPAPVAPLAPEVPKQTRPSARCPGVSSLSQQYTNSGGEVRCGPQAIDPLSQLAPDTRIVPKHVYIERKRSEDVGVPAGYRPVWNDDRLNRKRAERSTRAPKVVENVAPPKGYQAIAGNDSRLNTRRGPQTAAGNADMARVWENKRGVLVSVQPTINKASFDLKTVQKTPEQTSQVVSRAATRADLSGLAVPVQKVKPAAQRYVIAGRFNTEAQAKRAAETLKQQTGFPTRIGQVQGKAQTAVRVVIAGPFSHDAVGVLRAVRKAGYRNARLAK